MSTNETLILVFIILVSVTFLGHSILFVRLSDKVNELTNKVKTLEEKEKEKNA